MSVVPPRASFVLVGTSIFGIGMAVSVWYVLGGERHIKTASDFVAAARSVRIELEEPGAPTRTIDIQCPDRVRVETRTAAGPLVIVGVGTTAVARQGSGPWRPVPASSVHVPPVCADSPWNGGKPPLAEALRSLTGRGRRVEDARLETTVPFGDTCRFWRVHGRWDVGPDTSDQTRLCLSVDDQRPVLIFFPDGRSWSFTHWNMVPPIARPDETAAK